MAMFNNFSPKNLTCLCLGGLVLLLLNSGVSALICASCKGTSCPTGSTCEGDVCFSLIPEEGAEVYRGCVQFEKAPGLAELPEDFLSSSCKETNTGLFCTCAESNHCNLEDPTKARLESAASNQKCLCKPQELCEKPTCAGSDFCWSSFARGGRPLPSSSGCSNDLMPLPEGDFCVERPVLGGINIERPLMSIAGEYVCFCNRPFCNHNVAPKMDRYDGETEVWNTLEGNTVGGKAKIWLIADAEPPLVKFFSMQAPGYRLQVKYTGFEERRKSTEKSLPKETSKETSSKGVERPGSEKSSGKPPEPEKETAELEKGKELETPEGAEGKSEQLGQEEAINTFPDDEIDENAPPTNNVTIVAIFIVIMIIIAFMGLAWKFDLIKKIKDARYQSVAGGGGAGANM